MTETTYQEGDIVDVRMTIGKILPVGFFTGHTSDKGQYVNIPLSSIAQLVERPVKPKTVEERLAAFEALAKSQSKIISEQSQSISELVRTKHKQANIIRNWESIGKEMLSGNIKPVWFAWSGGLAPLESETKCLVKLRNGDVDLGKAANFNWLHADIGFDIVMYAPISVPA